MPQVEMVELRHVHSDSLVALLDEEIAAWKESLDWDFQSSAELIRRFVDMQGLSGFALFLDGRLIGYSYYVTEERKGLVGDLYVLEEFATAENEGLLLLGVLDSMVKIPQVRRIESQLMMLRNAATIHLPHIQYLKVFARDFMELPLAAVDALPTPPAALKVTIDNWTERRQDEAATLIAAAYRGHMDSEINDQYRSPAGARRFLINIVQYPGCGDFFQPAAFVAIDPRNAKMCGICLSSRVSADVGHITQVAVLPSFRGKGVGYELLRRALQALAKNGCRKATLTVTAANQEAIEVYDKIGFKKTRSFAAYVWEGF